VYCLTFISSLGTGLVTNGVAFIARQGYGFDSLDNYLLAALIGITYIVAAAGAGPVLNLIRHRIPDRTILGLVLAALGLLAFIPLLPVPPGARWPLWLMVGCYTPLTGVLWPIVESYVSGGRTGAELRRTLSLWNVVWSGAVAAALWLAAPLLAGNTPLALASMGFMQLLSIGLLRKFPRQAAGHDTSYAGDAVPSHYVDFLATFRILLPASYIVCSALSPYLPDAFDRLGVPARWHTILASAWLVPRVIAFFLHDRTQRWHGRWFHPILGGALLLVGFAAAVFAPRLGPGGPGLTLMIAGLVCFGTGMACIYSGAIYYVMAVHASEVEAGGSHETLVGVGYLVGPVFGLLATVGVRQRILPEKAFEPTVLGLVGLVAIVAFLLVLHRVHRNHRGTSVPRW
jgi:hypothetical protein